VYHWLDEGQAQKERFGAYLQDPASLFVFHAPRHTVAPKPREIFSELLKERGLREEVVRTFYQGNGEAVYVLSRAVPERDTETVATSSPYNGFIQ